MRVGFDEQVFLAQKRGGVSRYFASLIHALREPGMDIEPVLGWSRAPNEHVREAGLGGGLGRLDRNTDATRFDALAAGAAYVANTSARRRLRHVDVLHYTFYHPRFLRRTGGTPTVTTVHDMIPELFPEHFRRNPHLAKAEYVRRSDLVLCDSEFTKQDMLKLYGDVQAPTSVVHLGVDASFRSGLRPVPSLPDRYVLFIGKRDGYKDFSVLVEALTRRGLRGLPLVAVGGGPFSGEESRALQRAGISDLTVQVTLSETDLPKCYANAMAFVFPSRYEGFGLPTLEAMAAGCPTILADSSSLPEVGGDVAAYFPVGDAQALGELLEAIVGDAARRQDMAQRGVVRAAGFSWAATGAATADAYRTLS